jgi:hypothetical protein
LLPSLVIVTNEVDFCLRFVLLHLHRFSFELFLFIFEVHRVPDPEYNFVIVAPSRWVLFLESPMP